MPVEKPAPLKGGTVPNGGSSGPPKRELSDFDKFAINNMDKVIIGTAEGDSGVKPMNSDSVNSPQMLELPKGISADQAVQLQSAFKAIMNGQGLVPANQGSTEFTAMAVPPVRRDVIVPESNLRMWNPMESFRPTTKLSDMESSVTNANSNPNAVISYAPPTSKLNPKEGCSPVLIDTYNLLKSLIDGRWFLPGCPRLQDVQSTIVRLKAEIEE
jgi:hypothetical protein